MFMSNKSKYNFYLVGPNEYYIRRKAKRNIDYEEKYWGKITDPDGKERNRLEEREKHLEDIKQELEFIHNLNPGRILDVGCGLGFLLSGVNSKWSKFGVEVSSFAAEHAKKWGKIHNCELHQAKFPDEYFDVIVMHHVIEHMEDPEYVIKKVYDLLVCEGVVILGTPDFDSACARRFGENYRLLNDKTHISLFSNDSMHRFLCDHGFVIDRVEYPFFETRHFTKENLMRLFDTDRVSPPFYGNIMTFYCHKPCQ